MTVQSRVKVLNLPVALPGKCVICGSVGGDGRRFIDFGWQIDYYGAVYFCEHCIIQCMNVLGFVTTKTYDEIVDALEIAKIEHSLVTHQNGKLRDAYRELFDNNIVGDNSDPIPDGSFSPIEDSNNNSNEPESNVDESSGLKGSNNIRKSSTRPASKSPDPLQF